MKYSEDISNSLKMKKGHQVKLLSSKKILTEEVLEKFAKIDREHEVFRKQFQTAWMNVFGANLTSLQTSLQDNLFLMVDDCYTEDCPKKADCGLIVQGFFG